MQQKHKHNEIFPWEEFLDRYLKNNEEFCFLYKDFEIHLAFYVNKEKQVKAEFNYGTKEKGYTCLEFDSPNVLLEKAKINEKNLEEIWDELI